MVITNDEGIRYDYQDRWWGSGMMIKTDEGIRYDDHERWGDQVRYVTTDHDRWCGIRYDELNRVLPCLCILINLDRNAWVSWYSNGGLKGLHAMVGCTIRDTCHAWKICFSRLKTCLLPVSRSCDLSFVFQYSDGKIIPTRFDAMKIRPREDFMQRSATSGIVLLLHNNSPLYHFSSYHEYIAESSYNTFPNADEEE